MISVYIQPYPRGFEWRLEVDGKQVASGSSSEAHLAMLDAREALKNKIGLT